MSVKIARPAASQLTYQLYARALHPELFEICATHEVVNDLYSLALHLCESGHVIELRRQGDVVTEINIDRQHELPERGRCLCVGLNQCHDVSVKPYPGLQIQASTQTEIVDPEVFEKLSAEYRRDTRRATISHAFGSRNRLRPDAISLLFADCRPHSIVVHAFHTFPDDWAIIRTQSLYEF